MGERLGNDGPWPPISEEMRKNGYQRTTKQCRERWQNHLRPSLRLGKFTAEEDEVILKTYRECGGEWMWKEMKTQPALAGRTRERVHRRLEALQRQKVNK